MVDQVTAMLSNLKAELLEPVMAKGRVKSEQLAALDRLAGQIRDHHQTSKL